MFSWFGSGIAKAIRASFNDSGVEYPAVRNRATTISNCASSSASCAATASAAVVTAAGALAGRSACAVANGMNKPLNNTNATAVPPKRNAQTVR